MVGIAEASAILSSIKTAKDIAQAMIGLRDAELMQTKVLEFQSALLDAQGAAFALNNDRASLIETISHLKEELARSKTWNVEKQRYQLDEIQPGVLAYALKPEEARGEPQHRLCATCYENGKKSILQGQQIVYRGWELAKCHSCSAELKYYRSDLPIKPQPTYPNQQPGWMSR